MYLVVDPITNFYIFTEKDPREDGFDGPVEQDVQLDDSGTIRGRSVDSTTAVPCLGRSPTDDKFYRVFACMKDCRNRGFEPIAGVYAKFESWSEFQEPA